jgi:hypothetical protein
VSGQGKPLPFGRSLDTQAAQRRMQMTLGCQSSPLPPCGLRAIWAGLEGALVEWKVPSVNPQKTLDDAAFCVDN